MAIFDFEVLVIAIYLFAVICWVIQKVLPKNPDLKNQRRY
jgi:flagellar biogenesis protein FliO